VILGAQDLLALAQAAGSGGDPQTAVAVALAESGGDTSAVHTNSDQWRSRDRGLWQLNDHWHPEVSDACAFDGLCNARAAYVLSNAWTDFGAWGSFTSGAYQQFMPAVGTATQAPPASRSLYGQSVVNELLTTPWFPGSWTVTQGWGPTDYGGEPEGHGYQHWHAGVDVGVDCGTTITLPLGLTGRVRSFDNPDGYGTALVVLIDGGPGILLGHLRQRLVDDGQIVQGGDQLAVSNSTGNSTGCHVHFEVRPQDNRQPLGIGRYGTDVDPSAWLVAGEAGTSVELFAASGPSFTDSLLKGVQTLTAGGQVLMGVLMVIGGFVAVAYGARGASVAQLQGDAQRTVRQLAQPRRRARPAPRQPTTTAGETRIRPDMQRDTQTVARARPAPAQGRREARLDDALRARQAARRTRAR